MGEIVAVGDGEDKRKADRGTENGGERGSNQSGSSSDSDSSTGTGGRGTGVDYSTTGGNKTTGNIPTENDALSLLTKEEREKYNSADETEKKRILKNAKRRERYAKQKNESGKSVRPRKVNKSKNTQPTVDKTTINVVLATVSGVVASRPNCEHWMLTEKEIDSISEPLAKMLSEYDAFSNMSQYSNQIALVMACITVFAPRLILTIQKQKEVQKVERTGQHTDTNLKRGNVRQTEKCGHEPNNRNDRNNAANGASNDKSQPWYGAPIC